MKHLILVTLLIFISACDKEVQVIEKEIVVPGDEKNTRHESDYFDNEGDMDSGGGDQYAQEVTTLAYDLARDLKEQPILGVGYMELLEAIEKTRIVTKDKLILDGKEVDMINYPSQNLIEVSRTRWDEMRDEFFKLRLILHEFLGIMKIEDERYHISGQIDRADVCMATQIFRNAVEKELNEDCWAITRGNLRNFRSVNFYGKKQNFQASIKFEKDIKSVISENYSFEDFYFIPNTTYELSFSSTTNYSENLYIREAYGKLDKNTFKIRGNVSHLNIENTPANRNRSFSKIFDQNFLSQFENLETIRVYGLFSEYYDGIKTEAGELSKLMTKEYLFNFLSNVPDSVLEIITDQNLCHPEEYNDNDDKELLNKMEELGFKCVVYEKRFVRI